MARPTQEPRPGGPPPLPRGPIRRLTRPLEKFLHIESASGIVLLMAAALALGMANSPMAEQWYEFWHLHLSVHLEDFVLDHSLAHWVNDALMAIFFFVIGLEIKREVVMGELRDPRNVALPVAGAIGGAIAPAGLFLLLQSGQPGASGWAVPMATDIAFVVGAMALLGKRIPSGLTILMLMMAIVDDLIAVFVIAAFFSEGIDLGWLLAAGAGLAVVPFMNLLGIRRVAAYLLVGGFVWFCTLQGGIHPTVAGVALGLLTPTDPWIRPDTLWEVLEGALKRFPDGPDTEDYPDRVELERVSEAAYESVSPLERLENGLHPWVAFGIMPVFALANAGVPLSAESLGDPVGLAIAAGLVVGKPVGMVLATFIAVKLGLGSLPAGVSWPMILGGGALAGIGFTMALFLASLSLPPELVDPARVGILLGSLISGILGMSILWFATRGSAGAE